MRFANRQSIKTICSALIVVTMSCPARSADEVKSKQLLKERVAVLNEVATLASRLYGQGSVPLLELNKAKQAVCKAELDLCETDVERIAVMDTRLALAKQDVEVVKRLVSMAEMSTTDLLKAQAKQLKIEAALERRKGN